MDSYNNALVCTKTSSLGKFYFQRKRLPSPSPETKKVQSVHYWNKCKRQETIKWIMWNFDMSKTRASIYFYDLCKYGAPVPTRGYAETNLNKE